MQKVLTAEEMREVDRQTTKKYGIPSILLMENAAHAVARIILEEFGGTVKEKDFIILCGKGNNGGDGAALARILCMQGAYVYVYLFGKVEETKGDARLNFEILKKLDDLQNFKEKSYFLNFKEDSKAKNIHHSAICEFAIIDALFGTGLSRPAEGEAKEIISHLKLFKDEIINTKLISVDVPSGLKSDLLNEVYNNIQADLTITFTAPKPANLLLCNGKLVVANIGSPQELIDNSPSKLFLAEKQDAQDWLGRTKFTSDSYKNKRGHALLIVGSREYTGAAVLAGNAAMVSGVGLTTIATSESAQDAIAAKILEEVITRRLPETENGAIAEKAFEIIEKLTEKIDVIGIGCGLSSTEETTKDFVREVIEKRKTPIVIDADALNALSPFNLKGNDKLPLILTPHEGEFLRLLGTKDKDAITDRVKAVRDFAEKHHVILVLKGERVLIGAPDGRVVVNPTGNSGLGKAGNGDTLTGILTGFVAQAVQMKVDIFETVVAAIYISSLAGDIAAKKFGKRTMLASDVRECLGEAFKSIEN